MKLKTKDLRKGDIIFFNDYHYGELVGVVTKIAQSAISPKELKVLVKYLGDSYVIDHYTLRAPFDYELKVIRE